MAAHGGNIDILPPRLIFYLDHMTMARDSRHCVKDFPVVIISANSDVDPAAIIEDVPTDETPASVLFYPKPGKDASALLPIFKNWAAVIYYDREMPIACLDASVSAILREKVGLDADQLAQVLLHLANVAQ